MITEDKPLEEQWDELLEELRERVGKKPADLNAVLFLIGVQELGMGARHFSKEQKQDLMHIGVCAVLALSGYYEMSGRDADGWPHYKLLTPPPHVDLSGQEFFLKAHVLEYFKGVLYG